MSLTGYDDEGEKDEKDKMYSLLAETITGLSTEKIAEDCKKYYIYAIFGKKFLNHQK